MAKETIYLNKSFKRYTTKETGIKRIDTLMDNQGRLKLKQLYYFDDGVYYVHHIRNVHDRHIYKLLISNLTNEGKICRNRGQLALASSGKEIKTI